MNPINLFTSFLAIVLFASCGTNAVADDQYELGFSTFLGGADWEHARDVFVDDEGNIYLAGGTQSANFPTTNGVLQRHQDISGKHIGSGGHCDAFVTKFDASGRLLWSTFLGGPNYDRAYAVEVDAAGSVYVSGRAGPGFPVTSGSFQSQFQGTDNGIYGMQNGFVAKLRPDGSAIQWAAYVGVGQLCRDVAIDDDGDVYLALHYTGSGPLPPASWFSHAYQATPAGDVEIGAIKIAGDGTQVRWATWLGGSGSETPNCGIRVDDQQNVYLNFTTHSEDVPTTSRAHDPTYNGNGDAFIAKLNADGSKLLFGTYFGGGGIEEGNSTHNMALDQHGNAYLCTWTTSARLPVTEGVLQGSMAGGEMDVAIAKFATDSGALLACTYLGGNGNEEPDGIGVDAIGNVFFSGKTSSTDFPVTATALQSQRSGQCDATVTVISEDFTRIRWSSYLGGPSYDYGRASFFDQDGNLYLTGSTNGPGWPVRKAFQPQFAGGGGGEELCYEGGCYAGDVVLAKLIKTSNGRPR